jgi:hypothetical protein
MNTIDLKQTLDKEDIRTTSYSVLKELLMKWLNFPGTKREKSFIDLIIIKVEGEKSFFIICLILT